MIHGFYTSAQPEPAGWSRLSDGSFAHVLYGVVHYDYCDLCWRWRPPVALANAPSISSASIDVCMRAAATAVIDAYAPREELA